MPETLRSNNPNTLSATRMLEITLYMVEVSKIMRRVSLKLYTAPCKIEERVVRAKALDNDLECWLRSLPIHLQIADQSFPEPTLKARHSANYAIKQSVVLKLREDRHKFLRDLLLLTLKQGITI
jgi:hypothetical protein